MFMRYGQAWFSAVVLAFLLGFLAAGCGKKQGGPGAGGGGGGMTVAVVGVRVEPHALEERISVVGTLAANEAVDIKSEIEGLVEEIGFEEGQAVKQGDLLIQIDRHKLNAELAQAEANLRLAETTQKRYSQLAETRAVSGQEVDQAQASYETARAAVELVRAQLKDATVIAPFDGMVGSRLISPGQYVSRGQLLTMLIDADPMKAEFRIPERHLSQVKQGQRIELSLAAYPQERFSGEVYFVDPQVEEATRTVLVKARLPNTDGRLRRGMFANLQLVLQVRGQALSVPESALMMQGESASVYVVGESGAVELRPVTPGVRLAGEVEITTGIAPGETVIVEGIQKVGPGSAVTVRYAQPSEFKTPQAGLLPVR